MASLEVGVSSRQKMANQSVGRLQEYRSKRCAWRGLRTGKEMSRDFGDFRVSWRLWYILCILVGPRVE